MTIVDKIAVLDEKLSTIDDKIMHLQEMKKMIVQFNPKSALEMNHLNI